MKIEIYSKGRQKVIGDIVYCKLGVKKEKLEFEEEVKKNILTRNHEDFAVLSLDLSTVPLL